jgi:hypothetical protein
MIQISAINGLTQSVSLLFLPRTFAKNPASSLWHSTYTQVNRQIYLGYLNTISFSKHSQCGQSSSVYQHHSFSFQCQSGPPAVIVCVLLAQKLNHHLASTYLSGCFHSVCTVHSSLAFLFEHSTLVAYLDSWRSVLLLLPCHLLMCTLRGLHSSLDCRFKASLIACRVLYPVSIV